MPAEDTPRRPLRGPVVAIDGPSGSGKSSVARAVAAELGYRYLDTGAMYRALTWWALEQGTELSDLDAVAALARAMPLHQATDPDHPRLAVAGTDVTAAIRAPRISAQVSAVATNTGVRAELVRRQREVVEDGQVVAEGRDITTVVAPDAPVRLLLTADPQARISRRALELGDVDASAVYDQVVRRDADDSTVSQFHVAADGVTHLDSTHLDLAQTVAAVLGIVRTHLTVSLDRPSRAASPARAAGARR